MLSEAVFVIKIALINLQNNLKGEKKIVLFVKCCATMKRIFHGKYSKMFRIKFNFFSSFKSAPLKPVFVRVSVTVYVRDLSVCVCLRECACDCMC